MKIPTLSFCRIYSILMFFQLKELLRWLGLTVFEIWVGLLFFTVFTVLLTLKVENVVDSDTLTWWHVFSPLFISDALNSYFCVIVFIRMYLEGHYKQALIRFVFHALKYYLQISKKICLLPIFYRVIANEWTPFHTGFELFLIVLGKSDENMPCLLGLCDSFALPKPSKHGIFSLLLPKTIKNSSNPVL